MSFFFSSPSIRRWLAALCHDAAAAPSSHHHRCHRCSEQPSPLVLAAAAAASSTGGRCCHREKGDAAPPGAGSAFASFAASVAAVSSPEDAPSPRRRDALQRLLLDADAPAAIDRQPRQARAPAVSLLQPRRKVRPSLLRRLQEQLLPAASTPSLSNGVDTVGFGYNRRRSATVRTAPTRHRTAQS